LGEGGDRWGGGRDDPTLRLAPWARIDGIPEIGLQTEKIDEIP
jgi:hypothetical protein